MSKKSPANKKTELTRLKETLEESLSKYKEARLNSEINQYKLLGAIEVMQLVLNNIKEIQNGRD